MRRQREMEGGMEGARDGKGVVIKKKERGEMGLGGFSVVSRRAPRVHVFMCLRGR